LQSVLRSDVQMMVKELSETYAAGTVRNIYEVLARVYGSALDDRLVASTPCRRIVLPAVNDAEVKPPTAEEVSSVADAVHERYRGLVILLAGSGLRIGEALGLMVSDIDFLRRTVRVERQRMQDGNLGPTKTGKSVRTVPLGQVVVDELAAHLARHPSSAGLFLAPQGQPLRYGAWKTAWASAQRETGLTMDTHALRHFYASALIAGGASVKQVQVVLGHASPVITLRVYAHLWPGDEDRIRSISDDALGFLRTSRGLEAV
jgi:integrase